MSTDRRAYIEGLRELADRLERHPDAPLPTTGSSEFSPMHVVVTDRDELACAARCYGGTKDRDRSGNLCLVGGVPGLNLSVLTTGGVCERVQTGTKPHRRTVEVCQCGAEIVDTDDGGRVCGERGADTCYRADPPLLREVVDEMPVFETRCPDSILADDSGGGA